MKDDLTIAIIIARGGSRRLPRKNVKDFCGLPLVAWTIIQTMCSHCIDAVYVTTDDDEIESVARKFGANVIRRPNWPNPNEIAGTLPTKHAVEILKGIYGDRFKTMVSPLPTQPLNRPGDFDLGYKLFKEYGCDAMGPLINSRETFIYKKTSKYRGRLSIFDKKYNYLTQGPGWMFCRPEFFLAQVAEMDQKLLDVDLDKSENWAIHERNFFPVEPWQYPDTDTAEEFELGEVLMRHYILKNIGPAVYYDYADQNKILISGLETIDCREPEKSEDENLLEGYGGNLDQLRR